MKLQLMLTRQPGNKFLIGVGLRPAQPVIEMNNGEDDAEFLTQLDQKPQQRNRIDPTRNRNPNAVAGPEQFLAVNVSR